MQSHSSNQLRKYIDILTENDQRPNVIYTGDEGTLTEITTKKEFLHYLPRTVNWNSQFVDVYLKMGPIYFWYGKNDEPYYIHPETGIVTNSKSEVISFKELSEKYPVLTFLFMDKLGSFSR